MNTLEINFFWSINKHLSSPRLFLVADRPLDEPEYQYNLEYVTGWFLRQNGAGMWILDGTDEMIYATQDLGYAMKQGDELYRKAINEQLRKQGSSNRVRSESAGSPVSVDPPAARRECAA